MARRVVNRVPKRRSRKRKSKRRVSNRRSRQRKSKRRVSKRRSRRRVKHMKGGSTTEALKVKTAFDDMLKQKRSSMEAEMNKIMNTMINENIELRKAKDCIYFKDAMTMNCKIPCCRDRCIECTRIKKSMFRKKRQLEKLMSEYFTQFRDNRAQSFGERVITFLEKIDMTLRTFNL